MNLSPFDNMLTWLSLSSWLDKFLRNFSFNSLSLAKRCFSRCFYAFCAFCFCSMLVAYVTTVGRVREQTVITFILFIFKDMCTNNFLLSQKSVSVNRLGLHCCCLQCDSPNAFRLEGA